ncbi:MAG: LysM peptidoglycan-binding domain-containing protein [Anaerolineae bacterium]|nr:LysM peptidoglycan-binding domain-containing protein [Chloroflexota bacterium]
MFVRVLSSLVILGIGIALAWWMLPVGGGTWVELTPTRTELLAAVAPKTAPVGPGAVTTAPTLTPQTEVEPGPEGETSGAGTASGQGEVEAFAPQEDPGAQEPAPSEVPSEEAEPATLEPTPEPTPEAPPAATEEPQPAGPLTYTVVAGDVLGRIAVRYGLSVEDLARANGISPSAVLRIGDVLTIPTPVPTAGAASEAETTTVERLVHVVAAGDTLGALAVRYGVDAAAIAAANNISAGSILSLGQELVIPNAAVPADAASEQAESTPEPEVAPSAPQVHVVQRGENLLLISQRYGVTKEELASANNLTLSSILSIGQELVIPTPVPEVAAAEPAAEPTAEPAAEPSPTVEEPTPVPTEEPTATPTAPPAEDTQPRVHVVVQGDTLGSIAVQYQVSSADIARANNLSLESILSIGQELQIPQEEGEAESSAEAGSGESPVASDSMGSQSGAGTPAPLSDSTPQVVWTYRAPRLLSPTDGSVVSATDTSPLLQWTSVGILAREEWYRVRVWSSSRGEEPVEYRTKATSLRLGREVQPRGRRDDRLRWDVTVVRSENGSEAWLEVSPTSALRTFRWR